MKLLLPLGLALLWSSTLCFGQTPDCNQKVGEIKSNNQTLTSFLVRYSEQTNNSLLAELSSISGSTLVPSSENAASMNEVLNTIPGALKCRVEGHVLHVFSDEILAAKYNALNYLFLDFTVPGTVDEFRLLLSSRLAHEPWERPCTRCVVREVGGGITGDRNEFQLKKEEMRDISARDLLHQVSEQQKLAVLILFPALPETDRPDKEVWAMTESKSVWHPIHRK